MSFTEIGKIPTPERISRRKFLRLGMMTAAGLALPLPALARFPGPVVVEKTLSLYNTHTGETLNSAVYWAEGRYLPEALTSISHLLRDHRANEATAMDPQLFDLLYALSRQMETSEPFHVISGFRSPVTNDQLRRQGGGGVAKYSLHMDGKAVDLRLPGRNLAALRRAAMSLNGGGVGYYPRSQFVHVDTGRVRTW
ncbi:DUF882 domain-containing protein [uncultured Desulfuromonas sp.]|uniref:DUF882 domain-containing protein n=1 Tax=uncultured Desulfuromonas sp. TaxID=181013 RepID=UPI0026360D3F|nr:DUF882 domain-containing protein [uncultured Desulfuromonas sp.]